MFTIELKNFDAQRLVGLPHTGPYLEVGRTFEKLVQIAGNQALWPHSRGMVGLYLDDPNAVPAAELRSFAALVIADGADISNPLEERQQEAGRVAVLHYKGPYAGLKAAYDYLYGEWLPQSGEEPRDAPAMEIYLNSPQDTAPDDLLTDICLPLN